MTEWAILVRELGFPIAITLILILIGVRAGKWCANTLLVPLRDAHIQFLQGLQETQLQQSSTLAQLAVFQREHIAPFQQQNMEETRYIRFLLETEKGSFPVTKE